MRCPLGRLEDAQPHWDKTENWKIASNLTLEDLQGNDWGNSSAASERAWEAREVSARYFLVSSPRIHSLSLPSAPSPSSPRATRPLPLLLSRLVTNNT